MSTDGFTAIFGAVRGHEKYSIYDATQVRGESRFAELRKELSEFPSLDIQQVIIKEIASGGERAYQNTFSQQLTQLLLAHWKQEYFTTLWKRKRSKALTYAGLVAEVGIPIENTLDKTHHRADGIRMGDATTWCGQKLEGIQGPRTFEDWHYPTCPLCKDELESRTQNSILAHEDDGFELARQEQAVLTEVTIEHFLSEGTPFGADLAVDSILDAHSQVVGQQWHQRIRENVFVLQRTLGSLLPTAHDQLASVPQEQWHTLISADDFTRLYRQLLVNIEIKTISDDIRIWRLSVIKQMMRNL